MNDELTPELPREVWDHVVEFTSRVLPLQIALGPAAFEHPIAALHDGLSLSLAEAFLHPERVPASVPYVRPAPPVSLDDLAMRDDWETSECYCVHCGRRPVIVEVGEGDFYAGPTVHCLACNGEFHLG